MRVHGTERMQIQINTDHNIDGNERLAAHIRSVVEDTLSRWGDRITRVEVHLADENRGGTGVPDKRCTIEARLQHRQPSAVTQHSASLDEAIQGAAHKLKKALESTLGRLDNR
jgi:ribosome-associated translation inhibitor RaiA